jgi:chromosome segregation ATPase
MKEGSFETEVAGLDFDFGGGADVRHIPTPDQTPHRIEVSHLPDHILRSGVIESLINQNDDLMARLTVALRRVAGLEESIHDARSEGEKFKAKYLNVNDQILILKEQARILAERARAGDRLTQGESQKISELKEQVQVLEIRYAELYTSSRETQDRLERQLLQSVSFERRYKRYRMNVKRAHVLIREEMRSLKEKRQSQEALLQDLRQNLAETANYIATQGKTHKAELADLTQNYEDQLSKHRGQIAELTDNNQGLLARSHDYERVFNEKVRLENDLIISKRKEEESRLQAAAEIADIQRALYRHRHEAKELAVVVEAQGRELEELKETHKNVSVEKAKTTEQLETLQLLWRDQQNQIEKSQEQKNALQKLNQELSLAVNEYRREIRVLKEQLEAQAQRSEEARRAVEAAIEAATKTTGLSKVTMGASREDQLTPEIISKIDKVLTDLHVGR